MKTNPTHPLTNENPACPHIAHVCLTYQSGDYTEITLNEKPSSISMSHMHKYSKHLPKANTACHKLI